MKAFFVSPLVYFDGPQVALLRANKTNVIAVAVEKDGMEYPFFCCRVYKHHWQRYLDGKADLHFLFSNPAMGDYFFFDWNEINEDGFVKLIKATEQEANNLDYWPDRGFFSSAHTEMIKNASSNVSSKVFNIDGTWDAMDFSSFYGKISDVYAIFVAEDRLSNAAANDNVFNTIKNNVLTRLWQGGGSYSGFYNALEQNITDMDPLKVTRIKYASPGEIELRGQTEVFSEMLSSFSDFEDIARKADEAYRGIDQILTKEKLKSAKPNSSISNRILEVFVKEKADSVLSYIGITQNDKFFEACDRNVLVYAKLVMSIYRRFKGVYNFMSEGRVDANT